MKFQFFLLVQLREGFVLDRFKYETFCHNNQLHLYRGLSEVILEVSVSAEQVSPGSLGRDIVDNPSALNVIGAKYVEQINWTLFLV